MSRIDDTSFEGEDRKYSVATEQAEAALRARDIGDAALAERLLDEASRTDPDAVANVLQRDNNDGFSRAHDVARPASDEDVAAITRTLQPNSAAPSRAGIVDGNGDADGSGADSEKR